jgi:Leucine-rich repeat (LRR) protein
LSFFGNQLSGEIPPELGKLANLEALYLGDNQLSGKIPPELGKLSNLIALFLAGNQLSGCVPEGLRDVDSNDLSELGLPFCSN